MLSLDMCSRCVEAGGFGNGRLTLVQVYGYLQVLVASSPHSNFFSSCLQPHITTATQHQPTMAAQQVFVVVELIEQILLLLPEQDIVVPTRMSVHTSRY